jgi:heat shock protein HtpX
MPRIYVIPADQPNAFATGRDPNHAAVAVTEGITRLLDQDELEDVLAHELAHVKHRDILIGTIAATIAGAVMMISRLAFFFGGSRDDDRDTSPVVALVMMIVAPLAAMLVQMAISRSREYGADEGGAEICGNPRALANALRKLEHGAEVVPMDANPATAHMFIVNPFSAGGLAGLFSTHPPIEERVRRLRSM